MTTLVVTGTRYGRPDVNYWLARWADRHGIPARMHVGDALGVDRQAYDWAVARGVDRLVFQANWAAFGKGAGPSRNQRMVDAAEPGDWLLAFPMGESRGTRDCMRRGVERGLRVVECPLRSP